MNTIENVIIHTGHKAIVIEFVHKQRDNISMPIWKWRPYYPNLSSLARVFKVLACRPELVVWR